MSNPFGDEEVGASSPNPFGDDEVQESGIASAFRRGREVGKMGDAAHELAAGSKEIHSLDMSGKFNEPRRDEVMGYMKDSTTRMKEAATRSQAFPASPEYEAFQKAEGFGETFKALAKAPFKITSEIVAESLGQQASTLPLTIAAGITAGPIGLAATAGAASAKAEYGQGILELLMQDGVDVNNPEAVAMAMQQPKFKEMQGMKLKRAAAVGVLDAAAAGVAGVRIGPSQAVNIPAQMGVQAGAGMTGEVAGAIAGGEKIHAPSVIAEGLGEIPGGITDVASVAAGRMLRGESTNPFGDAAASDKAPIAQDERLGMLDKAGDAKLAEAQTGLSPAQQDSVADMQPTSNKPRLTNLQSRIVMAASNAGVDPTAALVISSIETGGKFDAQADNPHSSAHGLFQQLDSSWNAVGGGDRNDIGAQIRNGIAHLAGTQASLERLMGRKPTMDELYMGHLLGPRGASALIVADAANPQGKFIDTVRGYDKKNADAVVANNGFEGMTNEQAAKKISGWVREHSRRLGADQTANELTHAYENSDAAPSPEGEQKDSVLDEIDAMLAEVEARPPTEQEILEAQAEIEPHEVNPQAAAQSLDLDEPDVKEELDPVPTEPVLPRDLSGAQTHYGGGNSRNFILTFDSDVDKAAYIIANQAKKSTRHNDYVKFIQDATGMTEKEAVEYGNQLKKRVGGMAKDKKNAESMVLKVPREAVRADSGVSLDELLTRRASPNPNNKLALSKLPIVAGADEAIGDTLANRVIQPGEVLAVGIDSPQTPLGYMQSAQATVKELIDRFAPGARVALTFKSDASGASVSAYQNAHRLGKAYRPSKAVAGLYHINLRNAKGLGISQDGSRNTTTQSKITYSTYHEVGHAIADHQMTQGMTPETLAKFRATGPEAINVYFDESDFASLSPQQAAVLQEYNVLKRQVLSDSKLTTEAFAASWLSPWKLGHGWGKGQGLQSFLHMFYGAAAVQQMRRPARDFALTLHSYSDILSPHEYMAEQFARYAYSSGLAEHSPLARGFFQQALQALRQFFQHLKRFGDIKPGVAFAEWVDSLTQLSQQLGENPASPKIDSRPEVAAMQEGSRTEDAPSLLTSAPNPTEHMDMDDRLLAQELLRNSPELQHLRINQPRDYAMLSDLVRLGRISEFKLEAGRFLDPEVADKIRWDKDNPEHMEWRDVELNLDSIMPKRAGLKHWLGHGLRSLADMKHFVLDMRQVSFAYPEVAGLQFFDLMMTAYRAYKAKLEFRGREVATNWSKLSKGQHAALERALREEHFNGTNLASLEVVNKTWRFMPSQEMLAYARQHGLDEGTVKVWLDAKNAHLQHMNALENVLRQKIISRYANKPKSTKVKLAQLHQIFSEIRSRPFLPQTRFGQWALAVKEKVDGEEKIVHVEFFETQAMRSEAYAQLKKHVGRNRRVVATDISNSAAILRTLPPQILSTYADEFELTEHERKVLKDIADPSTLDPQLRKYSQQLAAITGANKNLLRSFADFIWHNSNNIAKLYYLEHFRKAIAQVDLDLHQVAEQGNLAYHDELKSIKQFMLRYYDHIRFPADEWQKVRAAVVVKMLWGNIKSAVANAVALKDTWALAATNQGIVKGTVESGRQTLRSLNESFTNTAQRILRQPVEGAQVFSADERWAMNQAKVNGLLDESFAAQLATFANSNNLQRLNFQSGDGMIKKIIWAGMLPQHAVEVFVRRTTLLTQFNGYIKQGLPREQAYTRAEKDVQLLQGDNSIQNRPAFMRGKAAAFLIFYSWVRNQLYLLSGAQERARNYRNALDAGLAEGMTREQARSKFYHIHAGGETLKMWMAYGFLGGMMGLPGAEDLDKVLELVSAKFFGNRFSLKEHAFKIASAIAEEASAFGVPIEPRSIVHGAMSDFAGFDLSPSVGLGQAVPGLGRVDRLGAPGGTGDAFLGMLGPLGGVMKQFGDVFSDDPSMLKKTSFFLPNTMTSMARSVMEHEEGVRYKSGGKVTVDLQTGEMRDLTNGETIGRLMGFQPSVITANKELHWMQKDAQQYWATRRNGLMLQMAEAIRQGDQEAIADVNRAVEAFNEQAPGQVKISGKEIRQSLKRRNRTAQRDEARIPQQRQYRGLAEEIRRDFLGEE